MGLNCYGLLYETPDTGDPICVKYMRYLKGPARDWLWEFGIPMEYEDTILKTFARYKGPMLSEFRPRKVDLGGGYFLILYWI